MGIFGKLFGDQTPNSREKRPTEVETQSNQDQSPSVTDELALYLNLGDASEQGERVSLFAASCAESAVSDLKSLALQKRHSTDTRAAAITYLTEIARGSPAIAEFIYHWFASEAKETDDPGSVLPSQRSVLPQHAWDCLRDANLLPLSTSDSQRDKNEKKASTTNKAGQQKPASSPIPTIGLPELNDHKMFNTSLKHFDSSKKYDVIIQFCANCDYKTIPIVIFDKSQDGYKHIWDTTEFDLSTFDVAKLNQEIGAAVIPQHVGAAVHYRIILDTQFHNERALEVIRGVVWHPVLVDNLTNCLTNCAFKKLGSPNTVSIEISGLNDDSRPLHEIQEIADLFYLIHEEVPALEYWMDDTSLETFLRAAAAGMPSTRRDQAEEAISALRKSMEELGSSPQPGDYVDPLAVWLAADALSKIEAFLKRNLVLMRIPAELHAEVLQDLAASTPLSTFLRRETSSQ